MTKKEEKKKKEKKTKEKKTKEKIKMVRTININTPYVSVTISSEDTKDTLNNLKKTTESLLDKYRCHHLIEKRNDYN